MKLWIILIILTIISIGVISIIEMTGAGGFERMVKISGIYSICRPDKYDVVCFLDADSKDGGMFCMPLSAVGGECKK